MQAFSYETLLELAEGRIEAAEAARLRALIAQDPTTQAELSQIERLIGLMRADRSEDAPDHVIARALRILRPVVAPEQPTMIERIIATIQMDSWRMPFAAGVRSQFIWPRTIRLNAGDREIDLQIRPLGDRWQVYGQILGPEEPGTIVLRYADQQITTTLSDLGEFVLPPVTMGNYTFVLRQGQREIIVPNLELGSSSI